MPGNMKDSAPARNGIGCGGAQLPGNSVRPVADPVRATPLMSDYVELPLGSVGYG